MKRLLVCGMILLSATAAFSQRLWFVYLQSEQEQPFFVKMDDRVLSANSSGYIVLSDLKDGSYSFGIGFPESKWPEQKFTISVSGKDKGYLLKNFGAKGWGLFDLQTTSVIMATPAAKGSVQLEKVDVSPFTATLSKAAGDTTLQYRQVVAKTEVPAAPPLKEEIAKPAETVNEKTDAPKTEPITATAPPRQEPVVAATTQEPEKIPVIKTETVKEEPVKQEPVQAEVIKEQAKEEPKKTEAAPYQPSRVAKKSESKSSDGLAVVYEEIGADGTRELITIIIPESKPVFEKTESKEEPAREIVTEKKPEKTTEAPKAAATKAGCKSVAGESDFLKLRRKMAGGDSDDAMIAEARKYFKSKCFTTEQIRNLSTMFLSGAGKYNFFDAAYSYVSDPENFPALQSEIKDEYNQNRFKAMLK